MPRSDDIETFEVHRVVPNDPNDPVKAAGMDGAVFHEVRRFQDDDTRFGAGKNPAALRFYERNFPEDPIIPLLAFEKRVRFPDFQIFGNAFLDFPVAVFEFGDVPEREVRVEFDADAH